MSPPTSSPVRKDGWRPAPLDADVRARVLDALGISAQLVFPTFSLAQFTGSDDLELLYGGARALNRAMVDFCRHDPRLNAVGFLPLRDPALGRRRAGRGARRRRRGGVDPFRRPR